MTTTYGPYTGKVLDWHDGDTAHIDLDLGFGFRAAAYSLTGHPLLSARIWGINAPELNTDAGRAALDFAVKTCPPGTLVQVISHGWDKYGGRFDASLTLPDGSDFAQAMLANQQAVPSPT